MYIGWGVAVCESCVELVFEGDGGWTAHGKFVFHVPCYIRAKHQNRLPQEVKNEKKKNSSPPQK